VNHTIVAKVGSGISSVTRTIAVCTRQLACPAAEGREVASLAVAGAGQHARLAISTPVAHAFLSLVIQ